MVVGYIIHNNHRGGHNISMLCLCNTPSVVILGVWVGGHRGHLWEFQIVEECVH